MIRLLFPYADTPLLDEVLPRLAPALRGEGIALIQADDAPRPQDRQWFDDVIVLPPYEAFDAGVERAEAWLRGRSVDGIVAHSEYGLLLSALLGRRHGWRTIAPEAALLCTNKHLCRLRLREAGVAVPEFALVETAAEAVRFAGSHGGFPVMLKGVCSTLGRNVVRCGSAAEVEEKLRAVKAGILQSPDIRRCAAFARAAGLEMGCDPTRQVLVETAVRGIPLESDGVVAAGAAQVWGVLEQIVSGPPFTYMEGYMLPADRPAADGEAVERASRAAVKALGLDSAAFCIEFRHDGSLPHLIEVNGRLGEDDGFSRLFEASTGAVPLEAVVRVACGRAPAPVRARRPAALAYLNSYSDGVVGAVHESGPAPDGVRRRILARPGRRMHAPPHPDVAPHLAYALACGAGDSRRACEAAREALQALTFRIDPAPAVPYEK